MRTDVHSHAFHPKIAAKVLTQLQAHYGIAPVGRGTVDDLLARARTAGIQRVVVHTAATDASQVIPANSWAMELQRRHPEALGFGTMHPAFQEVDAELDRLQRHGIRGLKIHADFQGFRLDDAGLRHILAVAADRFVLMVHVGDRLPPEQNPSCPRKFLALQQAFPRTAMIAAHLGGYLHWHAALDHLIGQEVWLDTSSSLPFLDDATLAAIWRRHPRERILFGSDYPLFDPGAELARLSQRLRLRDADLEALLTNANHLLPPGP